MTADKSFSLARMAFVGIIVLGAILVLAQFSAGAPPAWRPNIILIQLDDATYSDLHAKLPNGEFVLKNVHRYLIRGGTSLENYHASLSLCCPARSTLLTGQYAHNHTVLSNDYPTGGYIKLNHTNTLPLWLQQAGYYTSHTGKYMNGYNGGTSTSGISAPRPPGWDDWFTTVRIGGYPQGSYYSYQIYDNNTFLFFGNAPTDYLTDVLANHAVDVIAQRANGSQPYYMQVDFFTPHGEPSIAIPAARHNGMMSGVTAPRPASFDEADVSDKPLDVRNRPSLTPTDEANIDVRFQKRAESLLAVDEAVARIIRALKNTGQYDNTIIIFTSDNGWMQGEHRLPLGKNFVYTESSHLPFVISGPRVPRMQHVTQLVGNVDVNPTLLDLAHATAGLTPDGFSIVPLLRGHVDYVREDLLLENPLAKFYYGVHTQDPATGHEYVYAEYDYNLDGVWEERELYNLTPDSCHAVADPEMLESKHNDSCYAGLLTQLSARVAQLKTCAGLTC